MYVTCDLRLVRQTSISDSTLLSIISLDPSNPDYHITLANNLFITHEYQEAAAEYAIVYKQSSEYFAVLFHIHCLLL